MENDDVSALKLFFMLLSCNYYRVAMITFGSFEGNLAMDVRKSESLESECR
jgi:hypothetical protein